MLRVWMGFPFQENPGPAHATRLPKSSVSCSQQGFCRTTSRIKTPFFLGVTGLAGLCDLPVRTPSEAGSRRMGILLLVSPAPQLALKPEYKLGKAAFSAGTSHCQHCKKQKLTADVDGGKELPETLGMSRTSFPLLFHGISVPRKKAFSLDFLAVTPWRPNPFLVPF